MYYICLPDYKEQIKTTKYYKKPILGFFIIGRKTYKKTLSNQCVLQYAQ